MRRGAQHDAAMNDMPLVAPAAASLTRRGLMIPPADAAAARVPPPLRCGRRTATAWRPATHRAGAAAGADAASSTGTTLRGATCGGRDRGGADLGWKLTAVGAGTGAARTAGAGAAAASTQRCGGRARPSLALAAVVANGGRQIRGLLSPLTVLSRRGREAAHRWLWVGRRAAGWGSVAWRGAR